MRLLFGERYSLLDVKDNNLKEKIQELSDENDLRQVLFNALFLLWQHQANESR